MALYRFKSLDSKQDTISQVEKQKKYILRHSTVKLQNIKDKEFLKKTSRGQIYKGIRIKLIEDFFLATVNANG
jgi:hypothetical protein